MLWYEDSLRGVTVTPKQRLLLEKWVSFSDTPSMNPLLCRKNTNFEISSNDETVHLMLEASVYPDMAAIENGLDILKVHILYL